MKFFTAIVSFLRGKNLFLDPRKVDKMAKEISSTLINQILEHRNIALKEIFRSDNYSKIMEYNEIDLSRIDIDDLERFIVKNNNDKISEHFVNHLKNVNYQFSNGCYLLHLVCFHSKTDMIIKLLKRGANLECENYHKIRPIHLIAKNDLISITNFLKNINLKAPDLTGRTPYLYTCKKSRMEYFLSKEGYSQERKIYHIDNYFHKVQ
jgi:hypothetical protein